MDVNRAELKSRIERRLAEMSGVALKNCGTGGGGFTEGNSCARGGGSAEVNAKEPGVGDGKAAWKKDGAGYSATFGGQKATLVKEKGRWTLSYGTHVLRLPKRATFDHAEGAVKELMDGTAGKSLPPEYLKTHDGFSYASTQVTLTGRLQRLARAAGRKLDAADVLRLEETPHVTVKYGIEEDAPPESVLELLRATQPFLMTFGVVDCFPARETGAEEDVVILRIDSAGAHELHNSISRVTDTVETFPYNPHVTLAYLAAGTGEKYRAMENGLTGQQLLVTAIEFSNRDGALTRIPLPGDADYPPEESA